MKRILWIKDDSNNIRKYLNECLDNELYVSGGLLKSFYENDNIENLLLYYINKEIVGVYVHGKYLSYWGITTAMYVKEEYRRKGIATQLVKYAISKGLPFTIEPQRSFCYDAITSIRNKFTEEELTGNVNQGVLV